MSDINHVLVDQEVQNFKSEKDKRKVTLKKIEKTD